jgi:hypothetical protein
MDGLSGCRHPRPRGQFFGRLRAQHEGGAVPSSMIDRVLVARPHALRGVDGSWIAVSERATTSAAKTSSTQSASCALGAKCA